MRFSKLIALLIAGVLIFTGFGFSQDKVQADNPQLWLEPTAADVSSPQDNVVLTLKVGSIQSINSIFAALTWDPAKLSLKTSVGNQGVELGSLFSSGMSMPVPSSGRLDLTVGLTGGTVNGPGEVAKIHFNVASGLLPGAVIPISFASSPPVTITLGSGSTLNPTTAGSILTVGNGPLPTQLWLEPVTTTVNSPQDDVVFTIKVADLKSINSITCALTWDSSKLSLRTSVGNQGVELGSLFSGGQIFPFASTGRLDLAVGMPGTTVNGPGEVAKIHFNVASGLPDKTIILISFSASPLPLITFGSGSTVNPTTAGSILNVSVGTKVWPGDANNDGTVNINDASRIFLYWGKTGPMRTNASNQWREEVCPNSWSPAEAVYADCNGDGVVNVTDLSVILLNWGKTHALGTSLGLLDIPKTPVEAAQNIQIETQELGGEPPQLYLEPSSPSATSPLADLVLTLKVTNLQNVNSIVFVLIWDSTKISLNSSIGNQGMEVGSLFQGGQGFIIPSSGRADIAIGMPGATVNGPGDVAKIHFTIPSGLQPGTKIAIQFGASPLPTVTFGSGATLNPITAGSTISIGGGTATVSYSFTQGYNLIAIPINAGNDPLAVFAALPPGWRLFEWDAALCVYKDKTHATIRFGGGYWLYVPTAVTFMLNGQVNQDPTLSVPLYISWNMTGIPYEQPVPWVGIQVRKSGETVSLDQAMTNGWIKGPLYRWGGTAYVAITPGSLLQPTWGFWIRTLTDGCSLVFQKP
ncbi:MAG: dockerin type I domain-containing protein [Deltaproteobacteria bacterium]